MSTKIQFVPVKKDRLFYDRYELCMGFTLQEANSLRTLDHAVIDDVLESRRQWREISRKRWSTVGRSLGVDVERRWQDITEKTAADLHAVADLLINLDADYKLVVSMNHGYVYANDPAAINALATRPELTFKYYTQAQVVRPKNTIQLRNPQHKFRSYFRSTRLTGIEKDTLMDFLHAQRDQVRASPALSHWFDGSFTRTQDYFFVDHDTQSWLTMLALVHPGLVRKTVHIIPAK